MNMTKNIKKKKQKRTFEGVMLEWRDEITWTYPQRKIRGITIWDMKKLKQMLVKYKVIKREE